MLKIATFAKPENVNCKLQKNCAKMKTDKSIREITIAAINRSVMEPENWLYSKVCAEDNSTEFVLEENELPRSRTNPFPAPARILSCGILAVKFSMKI